MEVDRPARVAIITAEVGCRDRVRNEQVSIEITTQTLALSCRASVEDKGMGCCRAGGGAMKECRSRAI